jgi:hypothetical protein
MRQLWSMGWCHNRVRVVAAHFLVKHLLLPWQWGLKHLWDCQIDADLECDALGWQYVSGCLSGARARALCVAFSCVVCAGAGRPGCAEVPCMRACLLHPHRAHCCTLTTQHAGAHPL